MLNVSMHAKGGFRLSTWAMEWNSLLAGTTRPKFTLFYFARADDDVKLVLMAESSVLQREGIERHWDDSQAPTMGKWGKERALAYGKQGIDEVNINGVSVGYY